MSRTIDAFGWEISGDLAALMLTIPLVALFIVALSWAFRNERGSDDLGSGIRGTDNGGNGGNHRSGIGGVANDR
jgi:hypothetical protein